MTDLRNRVIAVLLDFRVDTYEGGLRPSQMERLADTLIGELGVEREWGCATSDPRHGCRCSYRYVTDWEVNDGTA